MFKKITLLLTMYLFIESALASGVSLGTTRVIYPTDSEQVKLKIYNSDKDSSYLVQSWISDENNNKIIDIIITPPLFVIKPNSDSILNVVYTGDKSKLPKDREKIFYLNSKVIPSLNEEERKIDNALLISSTTKIKLFIRPSEIKENSFESYKELRCSFIKDKLKIDNPTPFYINLVSLNNGGNE
ncbi:fimbria/pilus periplasmic chaperone, partial [Providencia stuartii]|uniref:fimbria/pilus periplasmic chaperone n=1 Tax=Providencia stuartii TaxID=588 RepID=UPI0011213887